MVPARVSRTRLPDPPLPPARLPRRTSPPPGPPPFLNLCGDYRFLRGGYWALVDAELHGLESRPTPLQAVTAQNAASALLVARCRGIATASWSVARRPEDVEPPCLLVPVAGLTDSSYQVHTPRSAATQWRSATQNGTRPALAVRLDGRLRSLKAICGVTTRDPYALAWETWQAFGIPLAVVWYLDGADGPRFVGLDPLPLHELTERELRLYEEVAQRPMSPS